MSLNSKFRQLARVLPYYPKVDSKGKLVVTYEYIMGRDLLKNANGKKETGNMGNEEPIKPNLRYKHAVVVCEDHFFKLKEVYKLNGEAGVREYCDKVRNYQASKEEQKNVETK